MSFRPSMATFIPDQPPRTAVAATEQKPVRVPSVLPVTHGLPAAMPGEQSWQRTGWRTLENYSTVETVDLTGLPGDSRDVPIVLDEGRLDDDQPDAELDATTSEDDDEQTLATTPPANRDGSHSSPPAVSTKPFAIGPAVHSAAGSAANGVSRDDLDDIERERPNTREGYDPSRPHGGPHDEVVEADRETPQPAAPAPAGHTHGIFAEDEKTFSEGLMKQTSRERKHRGRPSSRPTDPIRDVSLALTSPSEELVLDEHSTEDPDHTTSRKRSGPSVEPHSPLESSPLPKRPRRSRMAKQTAREGGATSARLRSHEEEMLRYTLRLPSYCRGNDWEVVDIDSVYLEEDGSLSCKLLWEPTMVLVSSLNGALLERAEVLVKEVHGAGVWEKWLEKQGTTGQRRRGNGGKSQGRN